jgi:hypothetical protein
LVKEGNEQDIIERWTNFTRCGANEVMSKQSPLKEVVAAIKRLGGANRAEPNPPDPKRRR